MKKLTKRELCRISRRDVDFASEIAEMFFIRDKITEEKARRIGLTLRQYKAAEAEGVNPKILAAYVRHMTKCRKKEKENA